ncbi:hypothetical protein SAMN03159341_101650 [Paenibacillus sp. 1_12]|uniref:DUF5605 domain-containing protein n=1 Tax=Paenibacillus sp. 1_12 TaxID=1566278 RepID=UPI0008EDE3B7|nr:DUF5605 domain-containing protein [Paenibacillus sp. 1_12]SFK80363.1 hypothetical protein SAMN03159341_101650 [Paenibacillus sp. 1_12]
MEQIQHVECWDILELILPTIVGKHGELGGMLEGKVIFSKGSRVREVTAFIDSSGEYRVRFMPDEPGEWLYEVSIGSMDLISGRSTGKIFCTAPREGNSGPVGIIGDKDFCYADGTPYYPFSTTCLNGFGQAQVESTIASIAQAPFNKIRFCLDNSIDDFTVIEEVLVRLMSLGVEAELLLDCGIEEPQAAAFVQQTVTRLAAYRNVWWSLLIRGEQASVELNKLKLLRILEDRDPYHHLVTIHSTNPLSDYGNRGLTHVSLQGMDPSQVSYYAGLHRKPILMEACGCEGDASTLWGSLPGEEMTNRIWESVCRGGYAGYGEMFLLPDGSSWHNDGGCLQGSAVTRIAFLRRILEEAPLGLRYMPIFYDAATVGCEGEYYLQYFGIHRFPSRQLQLPEGRYTVEIIDVWNMTVTAVVGIFDQNIAVNLPTLPFHALRISRWYPQEIMSKRKYDLSLKGAGIEAFTESSSYNKKLSSVIQHAEQKDNYTKDHSKR